MAYGLYLSAAGAESQSQRIEVISNNLANVNTPGFKREMASLQARQSEAIIQNQATPGSKEIDDMSGGVYLAETPTDFSPGTLKRTGEDADFALKDADSFFVIEKDGQPHLTRAGNFIFDGTGRLKTQEGHSVLSDGGEPITLDPTLPWSVDDNGRFMQRGARMTLGLAKPASLGDLARVGENLFRSLAPVKQLVAPNERPQVLNGSLEMSAVKPTQEMTQLIAASRAYEANIKMIQNQDSMTGSLISRVLG